MQLVYKTEKPLLCIAAFISTVFWFAFVLSTLGAAFILLLFVCLLLLILRSVSTVYVNRVGVNISVEPFADLHQRVVQSCTILGFKHIPKVYIVRSGLCHTLVTRFLGRHVVVLSSDVISALDAQPDAINFYIGHTLGHIHRKHFIWRWVIAPASFLPLLGTALHRSQTYTCDRYGAACCASEAAIVMAITVISTQSKHGQVTPHQACLKQAHQKNGLWASLSELISDSPELTKRICYAVAVKQQRHLMLPRAHIMAWGLAAFIPRLGTDRVGISLTGVLVAVLVTIGVPEYQTYLEKTRLKQAYISLQALQVPAAEYAMSNQAWPTTLAEIGFTAAELENTTHNYSIDVYDNGAIAALVGHDVSGNKQYIVLTPQVIDGEVVWYCFADNVKNDDLPKSCQD